MFSSIENNKNEIINLCKSLDVDKMYIFGSATGANFRIDSDLDFLISFSDKLSIEDYTDNFFELFYSLGSLFNRKIDLITENSLSNPYFIQSVNASKVLLYESGN
jgi:uncharacterized protein